MGKRGKGFRGFIGRCLRVLVLVLCIFVAIPVVLTPVYAIVRPVSVPMITRFVTGQHVVRDWRDLDQISDRLKASVVSSEDGQFCSHKGVDVGALRTEIEAVLSGKPARGASTLTMQVARNLFLWNSRSFIRKGLEVPLAFYIDLVLPKKRILEIYLNIAEWGPDGEFGIEAGAEKAFGMDADSFTWERASLLAVTLPNPHVRFPAHPSAGMRRVARIVERRAQQAGARISCIFADGKGDL